MDGGAVRRALGPTSEPQRQPCPATMGLNCHHVRAARPVPSQAATGAVQLWLLGLQRPCMSPAADAATDVPAGDRPDPHVRPRCCGVCYLHTSVQVVVDLLRLDARMYLVHRAGPTSFYVREEGADVKRKVCRVPAWGVGAALLPALDAVKLDGGDACRSSSRKCMLPSCCRVCRPTDLLHGLHAACRSQVTVGACMACSW